MSRASHSSAIVWHKVNGDLRIHDHEPLTQAHTRHDRVAHVFCFDPRSFGTTSAGFPKTGPHRLRFMLESVADLAEGKPEDVLPRVARAIDAAEVLTFAEVCSEEREVDDALVAALRATSPSTRLSPMWGNTLYHLDDLPFPPARIPDVYSQFRNAVEKRSQVRPEMPPPREWRAIPEKLADEAELRKLGLRTSLPSPAELGAEAGPGTDARSTHPFPGGESAALQRLREYFWDRDCLKDYKETRNGLLGADYSSKFSPWLAFGCLSPRRVHEEVRRYEKERVANKSTYWLLFELIWRDFFRFSAIKWGNTMFHLKGPKRELPRERWTRDANRIRAWSEGQTGYPFIDANMRELKLTGFMSNRGRQNVASFLAKDLLIDWRVGAEWFESMLIDSDPCSNYGNWTYVAGVGADPRENRYFNIIKQGKQYDSNANFCRTWVPEVKSVPAPLVHNPQELPPHQREQLCPGYAMPIVPLRPPGPPRGGSRGDRGRGGSGAAGNDGGRARSRAGKRTDTDAKAARKAKRTSRLQHA